MAYNLASEVIWHHICQIYQPNSQAHPDSRRENTDPSLDERTIEGFRSII